MRSEFFAPCTLGLESALEQELADLGAAEIEPVGGGVRFHGDRRLGYLANLWLRSAIRVQELLGRFEVASRDDLYAAVGSIDWSVHLALDRTLAIDASVDHPEIRHSKFAALVVKDAIVDQFRARSGRRPSVDRAHPDLPLKLVIQREGASLWRNLSGASLHKRGYREIQVRSPLNEATAAGLLLLTDWDRASALVDPMCGSGTLVIEAAMLAADIAPGRHRRFAFERWPDFDGTLWHELREEAAARVRSSLPFLLEGADRHSGALDLARQGARAAGVAELVRFTRAPLRKYVPGAAPSVVVVNPPYGERLGEGADLVAAWRDLGAFLHERTPGATAWILCGSKELTRHLGLKASKRLPVKNGPIDCRFLRYAIAGEARPVVASPRPSAWVERFAEYIPAGGQVLDLACGSGRNAKLLLARGHQVTAVDHDLEQLGFLRRHKNLETIEVDLESGDPWPLGDRRFDGVLVVNYLWRPLMDRILHAVAPGGCLIYETFARGQERFGKPHNPDFLLEPNELLRVFGGELTVVAYEHGEFCEPDPCMRQRICAYRESGGPDKTR